MTGMLYKTSRRALMALAGAAAFAAVSTTAAFAGSKAEIDAGVQAAIDELIAVQPDAETLFDRAAGVLIIPEVTKAGLVVGGAYGEGALLVGNAVQSYWSYAAASIGYQIGVQQTRQAMFFMTEDALAEFQASNGFEVGADAEVTVIDKGAEVAVDSTEATRPIIVMVYGREGLLGGASVQGGKYTRIER